MMETDGVTSRLQNVFRDVFDDEALEIHDAMTAKDIGKWDSLNHVHLILAVESEFGVRFSTGEIADLKNVGELSQLVRAKLKS